ncbi:MAG: cupin domain-containing protein [Chloroflexi bacterium]|nr:cupin domain-containing protein [Chloroflexota bacterium]
MTYTFLPDLSSQLPDIPEDSIVSRTLFSDETTKVVLFGFAAGQELSEHTASRPAIIHFLEGEAELTLGEDVHQASAGAWAHMPPHLPHSILAKTRVVLLLTLL